MSERNRGDGPTPLGRYKRAREQRESWAVAVGLLSAAVTILLIVDIWLARNTDLLDELFYSLFSHEYPAMLVICVFPALGLLGFAVSIWLARRVSLGRGTGHKLALALGLALLLLLALAPVFGWEAMQATAGEAKRKMLLPRTGTELLEQYGAGQREFREANLAGVNLRGVNLREAVLWGADLSGADLSGADLSGANLFNADLCEADLSGADLSGANLVYADLSRASLRETHLVKAKLGQADLRGADLSAARVTTAQLAQTESLQGAVLPDGSVHE